MCTIKVATTLTTNINHRNQVEIDFVVGSMMRDVEMKREHREVNGTSGYFVKRNVRLEVHDSLGNFVSMATR